MVRPCLALTLILLLAACSGEEFSSSGTGGAAGSSGGGSGGVGGKGGAAGGPWRVSRWWRFSARRGVDVAAAGLAAPRDSTDSAAATPTTTSAGTVLGVRVDHAESSSTAETGTRA